MYGDPRAIRRLATQLREQGDDIRADADRLVAEAEQVAWQGWAADAMRAHVARRAAGLRQAARAHDEAATALDRHADEVERLQALIAAIERRAHRLIAGARERLADLGRRVLEGVTGLSPDPVDELLDRFVPPPPGSRAWLSVDLPGLGR